MNQYCSKSLAKELNEKFKENGYVAYPYFRYSNTDDMPYTATHHYYVGAEQHPELRDENWYDLTPAFTMSELKSWLPKTVQYKNKTCELAYDGKFNVDAWFYKEMEIKEEFIQTPFFEDVNPTNALAKTLIWCLTENHPIRLYENLKRF